MLLSTIKTSIYVVRDEHNDEHLTALFNSSTDLCVNCKDGIT
jgi:hypothetical protein